MRLGNRFGRALPALAVVASLLTPLRASATHEPPLLVVSVTPGHASVSVPPAGIEVKFNQCVLAPPSSHVELRSAFGTIVSAFVSMPNCSTILLGPAEVLPSGQYSIHIFGITIGGATASMTTTFVVDDTAPVLTDPWITHPINLSNRTQVRVGGSGEPGSSIFIVINDDDAGTPAIACGVSGQPACGVVGPSGFFNIGPFNVTVLADSPAPSTVPSTLSIRADVTLTDPAGNVSPARHAFAFKDVVPPAPPIVDFPLNGQVNANQRWTISGTATPQTNVEHLTIGIEDNGVVAATTRASCASGACAWHGTILMQPGGHQVSARAIDEAGNASAASNIRTVTLSSNTSSDPIRPSVAIGPHPVKDALSASGSATQGSNVRIKIAAAAFTACATAGNPATFPNYSCGPFDVSGLGGGLFLVTMRDQGCGAACDAPVDALKDIVAPLMPTVGFSDPDPWVNASEASSLRMSGSAEPFSTVSGTVTSSSGGTPVLFTTSTDRFGNWTAITNVTLLLDGCLSASVTATDARGNVSVAAVAPCGPTLDQTAPPAPVILVPAEGDTVTSTTFAVSGTAGGGAVRVEIHEGGNLRGQGTAAEFTGLGIPTTLYTDGTKVLRARSYDAAGNVSPFSLPRTIILDANGPALVSTQPPNGGVTNPSGTVSATFADPDHGSLGTCTLQVRDRGGLLAMGSVGTSGMSCIFNAAPSALTAFGSPYTAVVQAADPAGNQSDISTWTFSIDAVPPPAPVISSPPQNAIVGSPFPVQGTAEAGSQVQLFEGLTFLGAGPANPSWNISIALPDGPHTITALAVDPAGNVSQPATRSVVVDTTAPLAPVISTPNPGDTVAGGTPVTGTAENGARVRLFEGLVLLGETVANPNWSIAPSLTDGPHTVTAFAIDSVGNTSPGTSRSYIVDLSAPSQPLITTPAAEGAFIGTANVTIAGTADAGTTVKIFEGATLLGSQPATPSWSFTLPFTETTHTVSVTSTDVAGNVSTPANRTFTVDLTAPNAPIIVAPGQSSLQPSLVTVSGSSERLAEVKVYEGATLLGTTTASSFGAWSVQISLTDGPHGIQARQTDPAGNTGPLSAVRSFTVDATAPGAPAITSPASGAVTRPTVTFTGTAEANTIVTLRDGGAPFATAAVNGAGDWTVTVTLFSDGSHSITAFARDGAGNAGPDGAPVTITTDGQPPSVTIESTAQFSSLPDIRVQPLLFEGTADDNRGVTVVGVKIVDVLGGTVETGTATCSSCGPLSASVTWSYAPGTLLPGIYTIEVVARDQASNVTSPPKRLQFVALA